MPFDWFFGKFSVFFYNDFSVSITIKWFEFHSQSRLRRRFPVLWVSNKKKIVGSRIFPKPRCFSNYKSKIKVCYVKDSWSWNTWNFGHCKTWDFCYLKNWDFFDWKTWDFGDWKTWDFGDWKTWDVSRSKSVEVCLLWLRFHTYFLCILPFVWLLYLLIFWWFLLCWSVWENKMFSQHSCLFSHYLCVFSLFACAFLVICVLFSMWVRFENNWI